MSARSADGAALSPPPQEFARAYAEGGAIVWTRRVSDLETPVSALLKLGAGRAGRVSARKRARRRFSRALFDHRHQARSRLARARRPRGDQPRRLCRRGLPCAARCAAEEPAQADHELSAGNCRRRCRRWRRGCSVISATTWRASWSACPTTRPIRSARRMRCWCALRSSAVFDNVTSEDHSGDASAEARGVRVRTQAYEAARQRLERVLRAARPAACRARAAPTPPTHEPLEPRSNTTPEHYRALVARCKDYARAGDVFQVVPSQRFTQRRSRRRRLRFIARCAGSTPRRSCSI